MGRVAYIDEGYVSTTSHYLLAAVIVDGEHAEELRETTRALPRRGRSRFHWHSEHPADRAAMIAHIATSSSAGVVVVSQPMRETRSERARAQCLGFLTAHCIALDPIVDHIVLESRTAVLDKRDAARINGLKSAGRLSPLMQFTFATKGEPLLWLPDALAGAVNAELADDRRHTDLFGDALTRIRIPGVP